MSERTPPDDADLDDTQAMATLRSIGLDHLGSDPTDLTWADVRRRSRHHRRRRRALPAIASAVALIVVVAGAVLLVRTRDGGSTRTVTTPGAAGASMLLPPASATGVGFVLGLDGVYSDAQNALSWPDLAQRVSSYTFVYVRDDGTRVRVTVGGDTGPPTTVEPDGQLDVVATCQVPSTPEPSMATSPSDTSNAFSCWWNAAGDPGPMERTNEFLRLVDEPTWQAYLREHEDTNTLDSAPGTPPTS